jgi:hypothetical protein
MNENDFVNTYITETVEKVVELTKASLVDQSKIKFMQKTIEANEAVVADLNAQIAALVTDHAKSVEDISTSFNFKANSLNEEITMRDRKIADITIDFNTARHLNSEYTDTINELIEKNHDLQAIVNSTMTYQTTQAVQPSKRKRA